MDERPLVGIVVVNYRDAERTTACVEHLLQVEWPLDRLRVVVVDNSGDENLQRDLRSQFPQTEVLEAGGNLGFGGANNLGFEQLRDCAYIALVNNDARPAADWLAPLVDALQQNPRAAAATPKVLLDGSFVEVALSAPTSRPGVRDNRELGVQLCGVRLGGTDMSAVALVEGFWGWEVDPVTVGGRFSWTAADALLHVPASADAATSVLELRLASGVGPKRVRAAVPTSGVSVDIDVEIQPAWHTVGPVGPPRDVINNVGLMLLRDGSAGDRGFGSIDRGQFDRSEEVFGWSGAAVLLRRDYLEDVGPFDDRFFLYYEDTDLSWRGRLRGWTYHYVPQSVVRHEHSATTSANVSLVTHLAERNRLVMLAKCAPRQVAVRAVADLAQRIAGAFVRDVVVRIVLGRRPVAAHVIALGRVFGGYVRLAPHALRERRRIRRTATVALDDVFRWAVDP